jgi:hypothetical protein
MAHIHKKYQEDFDKLCRDWNKLRDHPNGVGMQQVLQDLDELQYDIKHMGEKL